MRADESRSLSLPRPLSGHLSGEEVLARFKPKSDLSYQTISDLNLVDHDLYQSLLTGSIIKDSHFVNTRFARCDLDGMRIERSTFSGCDFTSCDVRSSHFIQCRFESCKFDEAMIHECEFVDSKLANVSFTSASVLRGRFYRSMLRHCLLTRGTFLHNRFYQTEIADTVLGDCTFLYAIFRGCTLEQVAINAESVGTIFGMSLEQLRGVKLIYLGQDQPLPDDGDVVELLLTEYAARHWEIGRLVFSLNYQLRSTVAAVDDYLLKSHGRFQDIGFIKEEELQFLGDILQELATIGRAPLLALFDVLEWCTALESIADSGSPQYGDSNFDSVRTLAGRIGLLVSNQLERFDKEVTGSVDLTDGALWRFSLTFAQKPAVSVVDLINHITELSPPNECIRSACFIESKIGSYIEVVSACVASIYAFQVFLFLLNGCIIQITELKHRLKVLTQSNSAKQYASIALSPKQSASPALLSLLPSLLKYAKGLGWLTEPSLAGLAAANVKSMRIEEKVSQ